MADRLINVYLSEADAADRLEGLRGELADLPLRGLYEETLDGGYRLLQVLTSTGLSEQVLDVCQRRLDGRAEPRIVVLPVEVSLPQTEPAADQGHARPRGSARISRQELYADVLPGAGITPIYLALVVLSSVVAAVGLVRDSTAVVIGAMVLAPLLGPNVALGLACTLGDLKLGAKALKTGSVGLLGAVALGIVVGAMMDPAATPHELLSRSDVSLADVVLALAAGVGAALSLTTGLSSSLLGVMVAVALLPPTVACGIELGAGHPDLSASALLMLATNVACVNLASVITFAAQGIRPRAMWEADTAKRATRIAAIGWAILVALVVTLILLTRPW